MTKNGCNSSESQYGTSDKAFKTESKNSLHTDNTSFKDLQEPAWKCRYVITIIGFFIYLLLSIHRTVMSVAIVAMVNNTAISRQTKVKSDSCPNLIRNTTDDGAPRGIETNGVFLWSPHIQGYILGSFFIGYIITQIPTGRLAESYGCKWFLFASSISSGIFTLLVPVFSWVGVSALIAVQAARGLSQGLVLPSLSVLTSNWFPKSERGFLYGFMQSATALGTCIGGLFTGYICESPGGWPSSFYSVGAVSLILGVSILIFLAENPRVHPRISKAELHFILSNQENILSQKRPPLPWRKMLTSVPVYALVYVMFGFFWALSHFWIVHSTFLGTILHYPIGQNGLFTALPFFIQFLCSQGGAWASFYLEKKKKFSVNFLRKFWTFIYSFGFSVFVLGMYFAGCNRSLSVFCSIISTGFVGLGIISCSLVSTDMTPTFTGTLNSICCFIGFMSSFIIPLEVGYLTDNMQTLEQWNKVFFISIGVVMSSSIVFLIFGSAEVQPWNFVENENGTENKEKEEIEIDDMKSINSVTQF